MVSEILSRWPVVVSLPLVPGDCDRDGRLTATGIDRLFASARSAYFDGCTTVDRATLHARDVAATVGDARVAEAAVTVSVSVTEIFPDRFIMAARVRPAEREGTAGTASCSIHPTSGVSDEMRDEFIAHAHAATHFH